MFKFFTGLMAFTLMVSALFIANCSRSSKDDDRYETLSFEVQSDLLSETFIDSTLGIQFAPPRDWKRIDSTLMSQLNDRLTLSENDSSAYAVTVREMFLDSVHTSLCAISTYERIDSTISFDDFINEFVEVAHINHASTIKKEGRSVINQLKFYQIIVMDKKTVNLKFVGKHHAPYPFQIDYIVPVNVYPNVIRSIESSIGSITRY
ncbi:hypothetical protein JXB12_11335 [candidate division KSB1 bacterium]|nr:hypothetical protein [candidate division KSB1 bacterium]